MRQLNVSHAFHSHLMEPMTAEFASVAAECSYQLPAFPIFSTLHGRLLGVTNLWTRTTGPPTFRATVRFADAAAEAMQAEPTHLVEFGAKRTLAPMIPIARRRGAAALTSRRIGEGHAVAALYRDGLNPDWNLLSHRARIRAPAQRLLVQHLQPVLDPGTDRRSPSGRRRRTARLSTTTRRRRIRRWTISSRCSVNRPPCSPPTGRGTAGSPPDRRGRCAAGGSGRRHAADRAR